MRPTTFMNESGRAVQEAANFFKLGAVGDITVFQDELELPPAKVRVKIGGGIAGHNGLRSISAHIGNDYRRVRLGIGHPGVKELVHGHVLSAISPRASGRGSRHCATAVADNAGLLAAGRDSQVPEQGASGMQAKGFGESNAGEGRMTREHVRTLSNQGTVSWDSNAVSSGCPMSASRRCSTR